MVFVAYPRYSGAKFIALPGQYQAESLLKKKGCSVIRESRVVEAHTFFAAMSKEPLLDAQILTGESVRCQNAVIQISDGEPLRAAV